MCLRSYWSEVSISSKHRRGLRERGALDYTVVVSAGASEPAALQYLAPYTGAAIAEHFMYQGKATLVIYDDLTNKLRLIDKCLFF